MQKLLIANQLLIDWKVFKVSLKSLQKQIFDQETVINNLVKRVNDMENNLNNKDVIINDLAEKLKDGKEFCLEYDTHTFENKKNKLGLSCAKLSSNWG